MSLEETVRETCVNLTSVRATDRKKSAESLKDSLSRNAVPTLLTKNTLNKKGYNWNNVFDDINDYIMKETEKFESSKTFQTTTVPLCTSLLHLCLAGSNRGKAYIKCEKITRACLDILNNTRLTNAIGDAYISLLYKHVLNNEHHLSFITPSTWENLLDICIATCGKQNSLLDDLLKIRLLWLVLKNACYYCQFNKPLRDSLSAIKKCCVKVFNNKKIQEFALEIVILILENVSTF
ncbi:serine-protein kinase ATM [Danaus plexippus plexippus]|uniref:Serine-protein kinase ATM n=1 Tax=Danaus plexippus plexippus TaxID=278856 RepID=A0A212ESW9_DANPL|nr:serine-protein kinase ATM [Danaus plexippus plexippus]